MKPRTLQTYKFENINNDSNVQMRNERIWWSMNKVSTQFIKQMPKQPDQQLDTELQFTNLIQCQAAKNKFLTFNTPIYLFVIVN